MCDRGEFGALSWSVDPCRTKGDHHYNLSEWMSIFDQHKVVLLIITELSPRKATAFCQQSEISLLPGVRLALTRQHCNVNKRNAADLRDKKHAIP
jgi:hypothetical protein